MNPEYETPRTDRAVKDCYLGDGEPNQLIDFSKRLEIENQILRDGLQYVMSERNPLGFATDKQVANHFLKKADTFDNTESVAGQPNDRS
jgi:hypothetical protein